MGYTYTYSEIKKDINSVINEGGKVIVGRLDKDKGFEYYYLLVVHKHKVGNPQKNTIVMVKVLVKVLQQDTNNMLQ